MEPGHWDVHRQNERKEPGVMSPLQQRFSVEHGFQCRAVRPADEAVGEDL